MENKGNELAVMLSEHSKEIAALAPEYLNKNRMLSIFLEAVNNPKIRACTKTSVLKSAKRMAELGTEIVGAGGAWLVPYGNELTVIPDWRLIVKKAREAGVITHATAEVVYEGDTFSYERGMNPNLVHKPSLSKRGKPIAVYCVYTLPDGSKDFTVMLTDEVEVIRGKSKAKNAMAWTDFWGEMAKKTVIRRGLKPFEGASPEFAKVISADNDAMKMDFDLEPIAEPQAIKKEKVIDVQPEEQSEPEPEATEPEPTQKKKPAPKKKEQADEGVDNPFVEDCEDCGDQISSRVAEFSQSKYGKKLCMKCQKTQDK